MLPDLSSFSESLAALIAQTAGSVVAIKAAPYRTVSGVLLPNNLVATTSHTLRREERVPVRTAEGVEFPAQILGRDKALDLAILKPDSAIAARPLAQADPARLTSGVLAAVVGMTADVGPSASLGIVGAVGPARRIWRGGTLDQFLRLDVNLYPSQSGAAVVNGSGELIGLATPALSRHAAIAIPPATLFRVARELAEQGRIRHGYIGAGMQPVTLPNRREPGLIFLSIEAGSPAEQAGLQIGDILLELNGHATISLEELQSILRGEIIGQPVPAAILRGGKLATITITVAERPAR